MFVKNLKGSEIYPFQKTKLTYLYTNQGLNFNGDLSFQPGNLKSRRLIDYGLHSGEKRSQIMASSFAAPSASSSLAISEKLVWIWTENKQVMTAAVERGWNTFIFSSHCRALASEWSCKFSSTDLSFFVR